MKETPGEDPYPHKFHVDISLREYIDQYSNVENGVVMEDKVITVAGWHIIVLGI